VQRSTSWFSQIPPKLSRKRLCQFAETVPQVLNDFGQISWQIICSSGEQLHTFYEAAGAEITGHSSARVRDSLGAIDSSKSEHWSAARYPVVISAPGRPRKIVEAVRHSKQIICQDILAEIVQHLRNGLGELTQAFAEIISGGICENQLVDLWHGFACFAKIERMRTYAFCKYGAVFPCRDNILSHRED